MTRPLPFLAALSCSSIDDPNFASWFGHHRPGQVGDFTGAQASLDRQQHERLVADGMPGLASEDQQVFNMIGR